MVYQARLGTRQSDLSPLDRGELRQAGLGHVSRLARYTIFKHVLLTRASLERRHREALEFREPA
jgi:hypothetical protein